MHYLRIIRLNKIDKARGGKVVQACPGTPVSEKNGTSGIFSLTCISHFPWFWESGLTALFFIASTGLQVCLSTRAWRVWRKIGKIGTKTIAVVLQQFRHACFRKCRSCTCSGMREGVTSFDRVGKVGMERDYSWSFVHFQAVCVHTEGFRAVCLIT